MPLWPNFVGQAYRAQAAGIATDVCANFFLETTRNAADPKKAALYGTPGQRLDRVGSDPSNFVTMPATGCRGLFQQDGRVFGVHGGFFYEYLPTVPQAAFVTPVANDNLPVTFASNGIGGNQIAICSAGNLYIFNFAAGVMTGPIVLPGGFVPVMVGYMDGYFLANEKNTPKMWFSNLFNGLTWSATDFFTRSSTSDNIVGFAVNNRRIYLIGSKTTEIFQDSGDATTPFIPYPGTVINEGTNAYASIVSIADTVFWVGSSKEFGHSQIFAVAGLQPKVISNPAISFNIGRNVNTPVEALAYTQGGHDFICWTFPTNEVTWCYDLTEDAWHQRQNYIETPPGSGHVLPFRWQARGCCGSPPVGGQTVIYVGQWDTPFLCRLELDCYTDQTATSTTQNIIFRQRLAPYLSAENQWIFLQQVELGLGEAVTDTPSPIALALSGDNARTFGLPQIAGTLAMDGVAVAQWFQLGRYRADRLVLSVNVHVDQATTLGPGLYVRATPGSGQL